MRTNITHFGTQKYHYEHYITKFLFKGLYIFEKRNDIFFKMSKLYPINNSTNTNNILFLTL